MKGRRFEEKFYRPEHRTVSETLGAGNTFDCGIKFKCPCEGTMPPRLGINFTDQHLATAIELFSERHRGHAFVISDFLRPFPDWNDWSE